MLSSQRPALPSLLPPVLLASVVVLSAHVVVFHRSPFGTLGGWGTDHIAHYGSVVLFVHRGLRLWTTPVDELTDKPAPARWQAFLKENRINPDDVHTLPGREERRPLVINWSSYPRLYPPGCLLFFAPEALLYEHTNVSFRAINKFAVIKMLFVAHLCVLAFASVLSVALAGSAASLQRAAPWVALPLVGWLSIRWALEGFYDGIGMLLIVLAVGASLRGSKARAVMLFGVGFFFHFRAVWLLPLPTLWTLQALRQDRSWNTLGPVSVGTTLVALSGALLVVTRAAIHQLPATNLIYFQNLAALWPRGLAFLVPFGIIVAILLFLRCWSAAAVACVHVGVLIQTPLTMGWHSLLLLPVLLLFAEAGAFRREAFATLLVLVLLELWLIFRISSSPFRFLTG